MAPSLVEIIRFEQSIGDFFFDVAVHLSGRYVSVQVLKDDHFVHRKDRMTNDIHAFFELYNSGYFHLRAYVRHMLDHPETVDSLFLTGYRKTGISHSGGAHALHQRWYPRDPAAVADEILVQNPHLFTYPPKRNL